MAVSIGIDLGTTYSCVATHRRGQTEVITNSMGERTTPSYVSFSEEERLVGGPAKSKAARNPKNTVFDVKRMIGRVFSDPTVQADRKLWPFSVVKAEDSDRPKVEVEYHGETKRFFAEEISSMVLAYMKEQAEKYIGEPVQNAVITVPAYFNDAQRQATKDAGAIAGLKVLRVINEPTAAALAYGLNQTMGQEERNVLVFDLGGGTFDVSLLSIDDDMYEVKATAGDTHLGGEDMDNLLVEHFVKEFKRKHRGLDLMTSKRAMRRLRTACERAKRTLSASTRAMVEVDSLMDGIDFASSITRSRFEQLCMPLFQRCLQPVESVLRDAGMAKSEVHDVVLVGGSTRIPRVRQMVSDFFGGKALQQGVNPDEAVAIGAAVQACQLVGGVGSEQLPTVVDVTPLSLGLETAGGLMTTLVKRGSVIPCAKQEVFTTHADNQPAVTIRVFQGEREFTRDNVLLGSFDLQGIAPAPRGVPQVEVSFEVDADSILSVKATDRGSSRTQKIRIEQQSGRLTQQQIDDMIAQAETMQEQDRAQRRKVEARNELENLAYHVRQGLGESPAKDAVTAEERAQVEQAVDTALAWLDSLPSDAGALSLEEIAEQKRALESAWHPVLARVQGASGATGAAAGGAPHHEGDTSGPRVDEVD